MKMPTEVCWYLSVLNLGAIKKYQNYLPNTKNLSEINTSVRSRFIFLYAFFSFFFFFVWHYNTDRTASFAITEEQRLLLQKRL